MAQYVATTRSNYFLVRDPAAFEAWCMNRDFEFWTQKADDKTIRYAMTADTCDCYGWSRFSHSEEGEDTIDCEIDVPAELAGHLADGETAILLEIGSEKLRYVAGTALAVHCTGQTIVISLSDIYDRASAAFGGTITPAEY